MMDSMRFPEKLADYCERTRMSQRDLADAVGGVSRTKVNAWLAGKTLPDIEEALRLARLIGVSVDFLADDKLDAPPSPPMTDDEVYILTLIRDLGMGRQEAVKRIVDGGKQVGTVRKLDGTEVESRVRTG